MLYIVVLDVSLLPGTDVLCLQPRHPTYFSESAWLPKHMADNSRCIQGAISLLDLAITDLHQYRLLLPRGYEQTPHKVLTVLYLENIPK